MAKAGRSVKLMWKGEEVAKVTEISYDFDELERDVLEGSKEWSIYFSLDNPFDEMMLLRLQAEMYAEQFRN